jgi:hypothetical protein
MSVADIISLIDAQILRLRQARSVLADVPAPVKRHGRAKATPKAAPVKKTVLVAKPGKPAKKAAPLQSVLPLEAAPVPAPAPTPVVVKVKSKRSLSPDGRKRIQEAQRQRWAERRKEAISPEPAKPVLATPSALRSSVPTGPVAVSAEEVRKAEARRAQIETPHQPEPTLSDWLSSAKPSPTITIDMLFKDLSDAPKSTEESSNVN